MSWLTELRVGVAGATAAESNGLITFTRSGAYLASQLGVYGTILPEAPDEAISLVVGVVSEDIETVARASFRYRATTDSRLDMIEDALSNSWVKRQAGTLSGVAVIMAQWSSGASLGQDGNGRLIRSANFYITANRPLSNRT